MCYVWRTTSMYCRDIGVQEAAGERGSGSTQDSSLCDMRYPSPHVTHQTQPRLGFYHDRRGLDHPEWHDAGRSSGRGPTGTLIKKLLKPFHKQQRREMPPVPIKDPMHWGGPRPSDEHPYMSQGTSSGAKDNTRGQPSSTSKGPRTRGTRDISTTPPTAYPSSGPRPMPPDVHTTSRGPPAHPSTPGGGGGGGGGGIPDGVVNIIHTQEGKKGGPTQGGRGAEHHPSVDYEDRSHNAMAAPHLARHMGNMGSQGVLVGGPSRSISFRGTCPPVQGPRPPPHDTPATTGKRVVSPPMNLIRHPPEQAVLHGEVPGTPSALSPHQHTPLMSDKATAGERCHTWTTRRARRSDEAVVPHSPHSPFRDGGGVAPLQPLAVHERNSTTKYEALVRDIAIMKGDLEALQAKLKAQLQNCSTYQDWLDHHHDGPGGGGAQLQVMRKKMRSLKIQVKVVRDGIHRLHEMRRCLWGPSYMPLDHHVDVCYLILEEVRQSLTAEASAVVGHQKEKVVRFHSSAQRPGPEGTSRVHGPTSPEAAPRHPYSGHLDGPDTRREPRPHRDPAAFVISETPNLRLPEATPAAPLVLGGERAVKADQEDYLQRFSLRGHHAQALPTRSRSNPRGAPHPLAPSPTLQRARSLRQQLPPGPVSPPQLRDVTDDDGLQDKEARQTPSVALSPLQGPDHGPGQPQTLSQTCVSSSKDKAEQRRSQPAAAAKEAEDYQVFEATDPALTYLEGLPYPKAPPMRTTKQLRQRQAVRPQAVGLGDQDVTTDQTFGAYHVHADDVKKKSSLPEYRDASLRKQAPQVVESTKDIQGEVHHSPSCRQTDHHWMSNRDRHHHTWRAVLLGNQPLPGGHHCRGWEPLRHRDTPPVRVDPAPKDCLPDCQHGGRRTLEDDDGGTAANHCLPDRAGPYAVLDPGDLDTVEAGSSAESPTLVNGSFLAARRPRSLTGTLLSPPAEVVRVCRPLR